MELLTFVSPIDQEQDAPGTEDLGHAKGKSAVRLGPGLGKHGVRAGPFRQRRAVGKGIDPGARFVEAQMSIAAQPEDA